ncbi:MAG: alpha,alpha-trehalase TreF [Bacteroidia bacterium]|nr:alpha,alpha-trehalase TreF [Bacteroidia bacterium]
MKTPDELYPRLFVDVQTGHVFPDSKTFVDAVNKIPVVQINERYNVQKKDPSFDLKQFVLDHFELPDPQNSEFKSDRSLHAIEHVNSLWPHLTRQADDPVKGSSLLALPHPYIVPGGRFGEIYYWDSYFTMLGLNQSGRFNMIHNMVDNFAHLIRTVGHIPNGNRSYFISRSQPPFFALMVELLADIEGPAVFQKYSEELIREHEFWMKGIENISTNLRVVLLGSGTLNRYWDNVDIPRQESWIEDLELANEMESDDENKLFRDIRAACESGWDFSTRWFMDRSNMKSICSSQIIPVDLNALLFCLESILAKSFEAASDSRSEHFHHLADKRKELINTLLWDQELDIYQDYNFVHRSFTKVPSAAMAYPLFANMASQDQAMSVRDYIMKHLLRPGGIVCTNNYSGQQWDAPNGWAPLQWIVVKGFMNYGFENEAREVATRWVRLNESVYASTGKFVEKYNVEDLELEAGGGEYPVQDGFGWSNGVYLALKQFVSV